MYLGPSCSVENEGNGFKEKSVTTEVQDYSSIEEVASVEVENSCLKKRKLQERRYLEQSTSSDSGIQKKRKMENCDLSGEDGESPKNNSKLREVSKQECENGTAAEVVLPSTSAEVINKPEIIINDIMEVLLDYRNTFRSIVREVRETKVQMRTELKQNKIPVYAQDNIQNLLLTLEQETRSTITKMNSLRDENRRNLGGSA